MLPREKRILMLNYELPPLGGGQGNANAYLLDEWAEDRTLVIDLVTSSHEKAHDETRADGRIHITYLDIGKQGKNLHSQSIQDLLYYTLGTWRMCRKLFRKGNTYHVIVAWSYPAIGIAWLLSRLHRIPYIILLRGSDVPFYERKWRTLDRFVFRWFAPVWWRNARVTIANSEMLRTLALAIDPRARIDVVPNGVDTEFFTVGNPPNIPFVFLCVSRLTERKGIDVLLRAFQAMRTPEQELWIVGEGEELENLIRLSISLGITEQIRFRGREDRETLRETYCRAHAFILPSRNEGMSNTVLEALAAGLPVIHTRVGGAHELVRNGDNGYIIPIDDIDTLAVAMRSIAEYPEMARSMGQKSRRIAEGMSWTRTSEQYIEKFFEG